MLDPTVEGDEKELKSLNEPIDDLAHKRIGLFGNGKRAAEPIHKVVREELEAKYPEAEFDFFILDELNKLKDDEVIRNIKKWAAEMDVCLTAFGDCGSCTNLLVWANNAIEDSGTPALGFIDKGFELDWTTNSREKGWKLRYYKLPVRSETDDIDRIRRQITDNVIKEIESELTRPLTEEEQGHEEGEEIVGGATAENIEG